MNKNRLKKIELLISEKRPTFQFDELPTLAQVKNNELIFIDNFELLNQKPITNVNKLL